MNILKRLYFKSRINEDNSTLTVNCIASGRCEYRRTSICNMCERNIGAITLDKNYFVARTEKKNDNM